MSKKPRLLFDCDGVLSDIVVHFLTTISKETGITHHPSEITDLDILKSIGKSHLEHHIEHAVLYDEFCLSMSVLGKAKSALKKLATYGEVFVVTAPYHQSPWMHHREQWLKNKLKIDKHHIIHTHAKYVVDGDFFIDDNVKHVNEWKQAHPAGCAILFSSLYNTNSVLIDGVIRTNDWNQIIEMVKAYDINAKNEKIKRCERIASKFVGYNVVKGHTLVELLLKECN